MRAKANEDRGLLAVIDAIYQAATDPSSWPTALALMIGELHSASAMLETHDLASRAQGVVAWLNVDPALQDSWTRYYAARNPYLEVLAADPRMGTLLRSEDILPARVLMKTEFYNDFMRHTGVLHNLGVSLARVGSVATHLTVGRELGKRQYDQRDIQRCQVIVPHLRRGMSIWQRLHGLELERAAAQESFDRLALGLVLLDRYGRALFCNRGADVTFEQGDGLVLCRGELSAIRPGEAAALRCLVEGARSTGNGQGVSSGGALRISRPSGKRPFIVLVSPLRLRTFAFGSRAPAVLVFISDPERQVETPAHILRDLYGLTSAETKVVNLLLEGKRAEDVADSLAITLSTARTHVKRILDKVGVHGQTDLVRMALSGPAALRWSQA